MDETINEIFGVGAPIIQAFGGIIIIAFTLFFMLGIAFTIFQLACVWKMFVKMGEEGWKSIIPFYNAWIICEHAWGSGKGWVSLLWLLPGAGVILAEISYWNLYERFGKDLIFCIIGLFFQPITNAVCAFDKSVYTPKIEEQ